MPLSFRQLGSTFIAGPNIGIYPSGNSFAISGSASGSTVGIESISTIGSGTFSIASSVTNNRLVYKSLSGSSNFSIIEAANGTLTFTATTPATIISGTNASTGVNVFCGTTTINNANDTLSFFTISGVGNATVTTNDSGEIVIDRGQVVVNTISNQGTGATIFSSITRNSLVQRTIISANTSGFTAALGVGVIPIPTSSTDSDATAFITAASITDARQIAAVQNLVSDLKTNNLWDKMQIIYPVVGGTENSHKYNLKDPRDLDAAFRLAFNGSWIHSSTGMQPLTQNVVNRANSFYNVASSSTLNNAHLSIYVRAGVPGMSVGAGTVNPGDSLFALFTQTTSSGGYVVVNGSAALAVTGVTDPRGFWLATRTSSAFTSAYVNGNLSPTGITSTTRTNVNLHYGCRAITNTSFGDPSSQEIAFSSVGSGLTASESTILSTIVENYQTTLGRQVINLGNQTVRIAPTNTTADRFYITTTGPVLSASSNILPNFLTGTMGIGITPVTTTRLLLPSGTAAISQIRLTPFTNEPTNPSNGSIWYSTSGNTLKFEKDTVATDFIFLDNNISLTGYPSALIVDSAGTITREYLNSFGQFNALSSVTISDTTVESSLISTVLTGSTTLLASTNLYNPELIVGRKFRFNAKGIINTTDITSLNINAKLGSTIICSSSTISVGILDTIYNSDIEIDITFTVRNSRLIVGSGKIIFLSSPFGLSFNEPIIYGIYSQNATITTSNQIFDCTAQFGTQDPLNNITITESTLEILN